MDASEQWALGVIMKRCKARVSKDGWPEKFRVAVGSAIERIAIHMPRIDVEDPDDAHFYAATRHSVSYLVMESARALAPGHGDDEWAGANETIKRWCDKRTIGKGVAA